MVDIEFVERKFFLRWMQMVCVCGCNAGVDDVGQRRACCL